MRATIAALTLLFAQAAVADPLLKTGQKPGGVTAWATAGGTTTLTLAAGFSAEAVAFAIQKNIAGSKATAAGGKVAVTGVEEKALLAALEKIDVAGGEDVDAMVAALQGVGGDEGSSIRATKQADFSKVVAPSTPPLAGTVVSVKHGKYPYVAVTIQLSDVPKGVEGIKAKDQITVVPRIESKNGVVAPTDDRSKTNIGAWYVRPGDPVTVALEGQTAQGFWVAAAFERAVKKPH
ncbi:MAG: hypothetical protein U1E65_05195 [Myxococcota bacterium]